MSYRIMLFKIEDASYEGNEAVERSKGNVSKAEDTIEAAQKEINVRFFVNNHHQQAVISSTAWLGQQGDHTFWGLAIISTLGWWIEAKAIAHTQRSTATITIV